MLSIIIPTKNEEHYLPKLLRSIKKQTLQPREVIVADAESFDKTADIARSFGCLVVDGGLPGRARNRGAQVATQPIILFLDADVELTDPAFLERSVHEFMERKLDFATCDVVPLSEKRIDILMHNAYNGYVRLLERVKPHAPGFCLFVKKQKHEQIDGFDESITFCEDHDYIQRGGKVGKFRFLKSVKIPVSVRRLDKDGRWKIAVKYSLAEMYLNMIGPIRTDVFNYSFGHSSKKTGL